MKVKLLSLISFSIGSALLMAACLYSAIVQSPDIKTIDYVLSGGFWLFTILGVVLIIIAAMQNGSHILQFFTRTKVVDGLLLGAVVLYVVFNLLTLMIPAAFFFSCFVYLFELHCVMNVKNSRSEHDQL